MILEVENLDLFYGDAQALDGISHRRGGGRAGRHRRRQRRRQVELDPHHCRHREPARGAASASAARTSPACRATASAIWASARSPKGGRSSPRSPSRRTWRWARCCRARAAPCARPCARSMAMFPRLAERRDQPAGTMSGGEQQMLAIARCLMGKPELIMFDEPSLGLAPGAGAGAVPDHPRPEPARAHRAAGGAERGRIPEARRAAPTCWRTAASSCPAPARSCSPTTACARRISGSLRLAATVIIRPVNANLSRRRRCAPIPSANGDFNLHLLIQPAENGHKTIDGEAI